MVTDILEGFEGIRKKNARAIFGILLICLFVVMVYSD